MASGIRQGTFIAIARTAVAVLGTIAVPLSARGQSTEAPRISRGDSWNFAVSYAGPSSVPNRHWIVRLLRRPRATASRSP
jgi:hypothetical protein